MKRIVLSVVCMGVLLSLCGCYDYHEINDTAMVAGIAIDQGEESKYSVSVEIIQPADKDSAIPSAKVLSEEGNSAEECLKLLVNAATKELHFSHCKLILFSEDVVKDGIADFVDYFLRDPEFRADLYLGIVSGSKASEMLKTGEDEDKVCSFEYASVIENSYTETGSVPPTKLYQYPMDNNLSLLPMFEKSDDRFSVSGARGILDGVQYAELDLPFTQSVLLVSGEYRRGELLLTTEDGIEVPCQVRSVQTKKTVTKGEDLPVSAKIECDIFLTTLPEGFDITSNEGIKKTEEELARLLEKKINKDWQKALEDGIEDVFGLGIYLYRYAPRQYETWRENNPNARLDFTVNCVITLENAGYSEERIVE